MNVLFGVFGFCAFFIFLIWSITAAITKKQKKIPTIGLILSTFILIIGVSIFAFNDTKLNSNITEKNVIAGKSDNDELKNAIDNNIVGVDKGNNYSIEIKKTESDEYNAIVQLKVYYSSSSDKSVETAERIISGLIEYCLTDFKKINNLTFKFIEDSNNSLKFIVEVKDAKLINNQDNIRNNLTLKDENGKVIHIKSKEEIEKEKIASEEKANSEVAANSKEEAKKKQIENENKTSQTIIDKSVKTEIDKDQSIEIKNSDFESSKKRDAYVDIYVTTIGTQLSEIQEMVNNRVNYTLVLMDEKGFDFLGFKYKETDKQYMLFISGGSPYDNKYFIVREGKIVAYGEVIPSSARVIDIITGELEQAKPIENKNSYYSLLSWNAQNAVIKILALNAGEDNPYKRLALKRVVHIVDDDITNTEIIKEEISEDEAMKITGETIKSEYSKFSLMSSGTENINDKTFYVFEAYVDQGTHVSSIGTYYVNTTSGEIYEYDIISDKLLPLN